MVTFDGGPADGVTLSLRRAPLFLRAVRDGAGDWDALDQLTDAPRPGEAVHVYRREGEAGSMHICSRDRKTGRHNGGWVVMARYVYVADQPAESVTRHRESWRGWCVAEAAKVKAAAGEESE